MKIAFITPILMLFLLLTAVTTQAQSFYEFRTSNWSDDPEAVIDSEGTDFQLVDTISWIQSDGTPMSHSFSSEGYRIYKYEREMLGEQTSVCFTFKLSGLKYALYSLRLNSDTLMNLIHAITGSHKSPLVLKPHMLPASIDAPSLSLIADYYSTDSVIRSREDSSQDQQDANGSGIGPCLYKYQTQYTNIYIISGYIKNSIVVLYAERSAVF